MVDVGRPPKSVRVVIVRSESLAQLTARATQPLSRAAAACRVGSGRDAAVRREV